MASKRMPAYQPDGLQGIIDMIGDGIDNGLDRMADGVILIFDGFINIFKWIFRIDR